MGAGRGAFSLALADLLGPDSTIHVIDRDRGAVAHNVRLVTSTFPGVEIVPHVTDFGRPLPLGVASLDGVVMANALHFVRDKPLVLQGLRPLIRPGGRFVLVEYGTDHGNPWVPWPVSYPTWAELAASIGFTETRKVGEVPSRFLGTIYAALSRIGPVTGPADAGMLGASRR